MRIKRLSPGAAGWVSVGAVVLAAEVIDARTMSEAFHTASRHPIAGPVMAASWGVLTAHLFGVIPNQYDPIHLMAKKFLPKRRRV
jgi:hypothetical protein